MSEHAHVVPRKIYVAVAATLMILLALTYGVAQINLGHYNVVAALVIAFVKALLVILFFMEVRWSSRLTWIVASAGFLWLIILIALTLSDVLTRVPVSLPGQ